MTDVALLRETMRQKGASVAYIARLIGKSEQAIHNKLNGKSEFLISEVKVIREVLQLTDEERDKIFYA